MKNKHTENLWGTFILVLIVGAIIFGFWFSMWNLYLTR